MARNYQVLCPTTEADGDSFDAWTARTRMRNNVEAAFEEARIDQCIVLPDYESASSLFTPVMGPLPIVMRYDRAGRWRTPYFSLLCCGGTATPTLRLVLTDTYRRPRTTAAPIFLGAIGTIEPYLDFEPGSGTTASWQTAQAMTLPGWWSPQAHDESSGDETGRTYLAWASAWITTTPTVTYARVAGLRWYESIVEEP